MKYGFCQTFYLSDCYTVMSDVSLHFFLSYLRCKYTVCKLLPPKRVNQSQIYVSPKTKKWQGLTKTHFTTKICSLIVKSTDIKQILVMQDKPPAENLLPH